MRGDRRKADQKAEKRGEEEVAENDVVVVSGFRTKKVPPLMWRECVKKSGRLTHCCANTAVG